MIYEMMSCDNNRSVGIHYVGRKGYLEILNKGTWSIFYFNDMVCSCIESVFEEDDIMTIKTMNTTYVFQESSFEE